MSRKRSSRPSKAAIVDRLCDLLEMEDYTQLEGRIHEILEIVALPVCAVTVAYKPMVQGNVGFSILGVPADPESINSAADACHLVARDLTTRALQMAMQPPPHSIEGGAFGEGATESDTEDVNDNDAGEANTPDGG